MDNPTKKIHIWKHRHVQKIIQQKRAHTDGYYGK